MTGTLEARGLRTHDGDVVARVVSACSVSKLTGRIDDFTLMCTVGSIPVGDLLRPVRSEP